MTQDEANELHQCRLLLHRIVNALERLSPPPFPQLGPLTKPAGPESLTRSSLSHLADLKREDERRAQTETLDVIAKREKTGPY